MNVFPVIERELRAEARNSYHHWLRLTQRFLSKPST